MRTGRSATRSGPSVLVRPRGPADGPTASLLRRQLWTYGFHELRRHLQSGTINQVNTGVPHPLLVDDDAELLRESADERDGLVVDTLARTVDPFVARLSAGAWRSDRGAGLDTYYLGALGRAFWDVYDSWKRSRRRAHREMIAADAHRRTSAANDHPSERIASIEALQVVVAQANPDQRVILARIVQGYSHREIADEIGTTAEGVGARLYRLRQRAWTAVEQGRIDRSVVPSPRRSRRPGGPDGGLEQEHRGGPAFSHVKPMRYLLPLLLEAAIRPATPR